jgi:hypothetical protein
MVFFFEKIESRLRLPFSRDRYISGKKDAGTQTGRKTCNGASNPSAKYSETGRVAS